MGLLSRSRLNGSEREFKEIERNRGDASCNSGSKVARRRLVSIRWSHALSRLTCNITLLIKALTLGAKI